MKLILTCPKNRNIRIELYSSVQVWKTYKKVKFVLYPGESMVFEESDIWKIEYIA